MYTSWRGWSEPTWSCCMNAGARGEKCWRRCLTECLVSGVEVARMFNQQPRLGVHREVPITLIRTQFRQSFWSCFSLGRVGHLLRAFRMIGVFPARPTFFSRARGARCAKQWYRRLCSGPNRFSPLHSAMFREALTCEPLERKIITIMHFRGCPCSTHRNEDREQMFLQ